MLKKLHVLVMLGGIALFAGAPSVACAWGKNGHDLVGKLADKFINGKSRSAINELLEGSQFKGLADGNLPNWADAIRGSTAYNVKYKGMAKWHFIDIDVDANLASIKLADYCANGDCALDALNRFQKVAKDPTQSLAARREAFYFIAHFVGDIHQPLHCADRKGDRGGNLVHVRIIRRRRSAHRPICTKSGMTISFWKRWAASPRRTMRTVSPAD